MIMKLKNSIPLIFAALMGLLVISKLYPVAAAVAIAAVPFLVIWQVVIVLKHKEPASQTGTFEEKWYENS